MNWKKVSNAVLPRSWVNFSIFWASISSNRRTYSVKLHTDHQLKKKKKSNNNSNIESIWWTNNTKDRKTTQITGIYHLHEKTTNYGWKLKRFVPFRMGNFRKNKLRFDGMQFLYTFQFVELICKYFVAGRSPITSNFTVLFLRTRFLPGWFV